MARARRRSVRLWQTELFVIVIAVAILILSVSLSEGLQRTLKELGESEQLSNTAALAGELSAEFPLTVESRARIREEVEQFREVYGDDVWVFDVDGTVIDESFEEELPQEVLEEAHSEAVIDATPYATMELTPDGRVVAARPVHNANDDRTAAVVVTSGSVDNSMAVLNAVRGRLWTTFWIALIVAGLLGFGFAEYIGRSVRRMSHAAVAIADGDFDQRLPTGLVPDEIRELAESYNRMAATLGEAFSTLREQEQEITAVVESMGEGVIAFDADGAVRVINPEAISMLELELDAAEDADLRVADLGDDETIRSLVDRSLAGFDVLDTATFGERTILLHGTPIAAEADEEEGAVLLMRDMTERMRLEEAQRRFVANASHEMRTPIAALKGLLELLDSGAKEDPETRDDFLRTMTLEVDRLGRLVGDLLTLAQLEAGSLQLKLEPVNVAELLGEVATVMRSLAERSGVELVVEAQDTPLIALCDRDRITQVLLGFVDNAVKYSDGGKVVTMRATPHDDVVTLEVHNEGAGIEPEMIPHLFDRFFRVDESRATPKGTGLGLSIAGEIIEAHESAVHVESAPGEGATFSFDLPVSG
jgi:signal transduction histidine kinase